jgi:hypothetical protein
LSNINSNNTDWKAAKTCEHDFSGPPCVLPWCIGGGVTCTKCHVCSKSGTWLKKKADYVQNENTFDPEPKIAQYDDFLKVSPPYDDFLKASDIEKSIKEMISKPPKLTYKPKLSYKFNYSTIQSLGQLSQSPSQNGGKTTVLERIKYLVEIAKVIIDQADSGKTPDIEVLRNFDASLKNLREEG